MAGPANLVVNILGSAKGLNKALKDAGKKTKGFAKGVKIAAAGAAAALGALGGILISSVKAAIAEEQAMSRLSSAVLRVKGSTKATTVAVENWIDAVKIGSTFSDDDLRPALGRLVDATDNVKRAQNLLKVAMDLSVASGKPLETVSTALGKAYNGNKTALLKLFPELAKVNDKSKTGRDLIDALGKKYKTADENASNTAAGGLQDLQDVFNDLQETIGTQFLPYLKDFSKWAKSREGKEVIANLTTVVQGLASAFIAVVGGVDEVIIGFKSIKAFFKSQEYSDLLDIIKFVNPVLYAAIRGTRPDNPRPLSELLNEVVNGPAPSGRANNTRNRPRNNGGAVKTADVGAGRPVTVIVQTIDPAAAGRAVRQALNTDAVRTGRSQVPQGRTAVKTGYYRNGGIV